MQELKLFSKSNQCHPVSFPDCRLWSHSRRAVNALHSSTCLHLQSRTPPTSETAVAMTTGVCCHLPGSLCDCASSTGLWKSMDEGGLCVSTTSSGGGGGSDGCPALYVTQVTSMDGHLLSSVLKPVSAQRWAVPTVAPHTWWTLSAGNAAHWANLSFLLFKCPNQSSSNTLHEYTNCHFTRLIIHRFVATVPVIMWIILIILILLICVLVYTLSVNYGCSFNLNN